jgi:hypothetical protein
MILYVTRGAYHNPTRDEPQLIALGRARTGSKPLNRPLELAGRTFTCAIRLDFDVVLPEQQGVPVRPLVGRLSMVERKDAWGAYFRSSLIRLSADDAALLRGEIQAAAVGGRVGGSVR